MNFRSMSCGGIKASFCTAVLALLMVSTGFAGEHDCGPLKNFNDFGPFDYQAPENRVSTGADPMGRIKRVENVHFQDEMKLINLKQFSIDRLSGEFTYTLRIFPNHPEALHALSKLERVAGGKLPQTALTVFTPKISADCFFDRAIRFRPEDKAVHLVYGMHLHQRRNFKEALVAYEKAEALGEESTYLSYNLGLLHTDLKNWEKAAAYARKAYGKGATFPGLRERIEKAGYTVPLVGHSEAELSVDSPSAN